MLNTYFIILLYTFIAIIIGITLISKYLDLSKNRLKSFVKSTSLNAKILVLVLIIYIISLPVQLVLLSRDYQKLSVEGSRYYDVIDVGNGVVAVGYKRSSMKNNEGNYFINSRATIAKYSYSGDVIWEKIYYEYYENTSHFFDVALTSDGRIIAIGNERMGNSQKELIALFTQDGDLITKQNKAQNKYIKPLEDGTLIYVDYDSDKDSDDIIITRNTLDDSKLSQYIYDYENTIETTYNLSHSVSVVGKTDSRIFINLSISQLNDVILEERLLEFDLDLNLIDEHVFEKQRSIAQIKEYNNKYYILWNNQQERKSYLTSHNLSMIEYWEKEIKGQTPYIQMNDIEFQDYKIYLFGIEYENEEKVWFTEDYDGFVFETTIVGGEDNYYFLGKGLGINNALIRDNQIYSVGSLNTHAAFLSNSKYQKYPYQGFLAITDLENFKTKIIDYL